MLECISKENLSNVKKRDFEYKIEEIKGNFVLTNEAKERLQKIKNFFDSKIPIMLEGPTGTSKTKTIQVLCSLLKKKLIRFNLSNETTIEDLIGRLGSGGEDSWSSFKFVPGPFTEACEHGHVLLLDEVNLGQKSVLQCMETALDTGEIKQDIPGCGTIKKTIKKDFILVATQNPKIEGFTNQRDELSQKFLSRFTVVEFPSFEIDELRIIAEGIADKNNYIKKDIVKMISDLHYRWVYKEKASKSSSQCFTVRDINATIKAISEGQDPSDAVNCFYGSRYRGEAFEHLMEILKNDFPPLYKDLNLIPELPSDFPKCYSNFSLRKAFYFAKIAKKNGRHLLIVGKEGTGVTQISKWISWYFTPEEKRNENFLFIFSPETTVSDMIGKFTPKGDTIDSSSGIFEWRNGPLTNAVKEGYSGIFDNISSAPAKVIESLNALLDPKDSDEDYYFEIPQNISEPKIRIHPDFLFVATCTLSQMENLSPAFLNRFTVINLEDQLEGASEAQEKEAIKCIIDLENNEISKKDELIEHFYKIFKEKKLNISSLARFIKSTVRLFELIDNIDNVEEIVIYMKDLILTKSIKIDIPIIVQNKASSIFDKYEQLSNEERFYYQNSPNLRNLMTNLYICSECRIPVCLVGATGLGKTSMARAFCEIVRREYATLYSFHAETQLSDLYGVFNFEAGKPVIQDGPLVKTMENGQVFIADEFNLAEEAVLQTITVALEPSDDNSMFLVPDTGKKIKRKNSFFFIACQNDLSTSGRRKLPEIIQKRLRIFEYPSPMIKDLQSSIEEMTRFEKVVGSKFSLYVDFASRIANFMFKLNEANYPEIGKWSMRNIRKLYRRLTKQQINDSSYYNITIEHQIVFYILGTIPGGVVEKLSVYDKISGILKSTFDLKEELDNKIRNCLECKPRIIEINKKKFLVKGDSEKTLQDREKSDKMEIFTHSVGEAGILLDKPIEDKIDLSSLYETLFYILFSHYKEPLLLCGPSGYKSKLAKDISPGACVINFYPEISNAQLIGNVSLVVNYQAKEYYLEQICKICKKEGKLKDLKEQLKEYYLEKKKEAFQIREKKLKEQRKKQIEELKKKKEEKIKETEELKEGNKKDNKNEVDKNEKIKEEVDDKKDKIEEDLEEDKKEKKGENSDENDSSDNKKKKNKKRKEEESDSNEYKKKKKTEEKNEESNEDNNEDKKKKKKKKEEESEEDDSDDNKKKKKKKNNESDEDESEDNKKKKKKKKKKKNDEDSDEDESEDDKKKKKKKKKDKDSGEDSEDNSDEIKESDSSDESTNDVSEIKELKNAEIKYDIIRKFEDKVTKLINDCKKEKILPKCFESIIEHLKKNLTEFDVSFTEGIFGDFTSVFKTGILTEKIFSQSPLITENLPNLPTAVIERCNDLFNYNPKISLSEDTCNTFTKEDKELNGFADGFRVIATSTELAIRNLSDAAQSRFTIIYTTSYTSDERDLIIQIFYKDTPKEFYTFLKEYKINFRKELSFLYVTKILNILKLIDSKFDKDNLEKEEIRKRNLCLAIYLSLNFLMNNTRNKKKFKAILNKILPKFCHIKEKSDEDEMEKEIEIEDEVPFEFIGEELHSNWSNLSITSCDLKEDNDSNLAFIKPFNKLLEHIFISISIHYPLIIEGGTGKGKKSAIYYMAKILGYDVIYFNISNSTTVDDLFCKKMPKEKNGNMAFIDIRSLLLDGIDANVKKDKNCIIILDNLQQANSNVLESLIPLFDTNTKSILVQGEEIIKRSYNIFGIIDSSMESKNSNEFLPDSIKHSTILFKNSKYLKRNYCRKIIDKMFGDEINDENEPKIEYYLNSYIKLNNYVLEKQIKELFTFNDFKKFLFFLKKSRTDPNNPTTSIFDIKTITQLLLVYKFKSKDEINSANQILGNSLVSNFWPIFSYLSDENKEDEPEEDEFQIAPDNQGENLCYKTKNALKKKDREKLLLKTHSLTPDQRRGIIFLMLSVLSDVPCVIQGITASGKTHLIRLFCELLGHKPLIIDINNDTGISILLRQLVPKEQLEKKKIKKIKKKINNLLQKEGKVFQDEIEKIIDLQNSDNWVPSNFRNLIKLLEDKSFEINNENLLLVSELKSILNEQLSFFKHLTNEDSSFIKAMINGDWVILDGIESAQPELYQRISSLCDLENQNLTMYDNGPEYVYTKDSENEKFKIHSDFRLFITYNPFEVEPSKMLPQSFLNKCLTFSLSGIDENIKTTSLVLSGLFMQKNLYKNLEEEYYENNKKLLKEKMPSLEKEEIINNLFKEDLRILGTKFAKIHHFSNELAINNKEDFAGKKTFSGRSIKFILNSLEINPKNINEGIISVIQDIYCYPYKKSQIKLKEDLITKFVEPPENELLQFLRNDEVIANEKYKSIMNDLVTIKTKPDISFDMSQFITSSFAYIYKDIPSLIEEIEKCLCSIDIENINYTYLSLFKVILLNFKERKGNDGEIEKNLRKKNINDLVLTREDKFLAVPQNLLFLYQSLLDKKLIKKIAYIDYLKYMDIINKTEEVGDSIEKEDLKEYDDIEADIENNEDENLNEKEKDYKNEPLIIISNKEEEFIQKKSLKGDKPFEELCLDKSNLVGSLVTLTISYPELNDKTKEELEELFKNLEDFNKELFILLIKLFNNSEFNGEKEEIDICEQISQFLENESFISAIEDTYAKDELLKDTDPDKDKLLIEECSKIKKKLNNLSRVNLVSCKTDDDIVKNYFNDWNNNYEKYMKDLEEAFYIKIGKENEHKIKKKFDDLISKLKSKKSKISNYFVKGLFDDLIDHLNSIKVYTEENYAIAEIDVNNALLDSDSYIDSTSKTTYIHFPIIDFDGEYKIRGSFQEIYTLLMDFSDSNNLLDDFEKNEDKRTCMNLGKLKKYLKIQEESTSEGIKIQYNILYDKIMSHSDKILEYIKEFRECLLSNLIMNIYKIDKRFLNINFIIEKLNNYCKRNVIKKDSYEIDLEWASFLSKTREPFDEIILPDFSPESIIKLFTLKNEKNENDEGIFSISLVNNNKEEFYNEVDLLLKDETIENIHNIISLIFEKAMKTIYTDTENIANVEQIQKIFEDKYKKKDKIGDVDIEVIKEIKENIKADISHKQFIDL